MADVPVAPMLNSGNIRQVPTVMIGEKGRPSRANGSHERTTNGGRIKGLDALRGLAASSVMAYHYTAYHDFFMGPHTGPMIVTWPWGNFGVELFFIISGYVIFMTVDRTPSPWGFFASRVSRLWPAFVTCAILTALATSLLTSDSRLHSSVIDVIVNATMLQHFFWTHDVDPVYWSLAYEIAFYASLAVTWYGLKRLGPGRVNVYCATLLVVILGYKLWIWHGGHVFYRLKVVSLAPYANLFVAGIMIYRVQSKAAGPWAYALLGAALSEAVLGPEYAYRPIGIWAYTVLIWAFILCVYMAASGRLEKYAIRPLVILGEASYPLYLLHMFVGFSAIQMLESIGIEANVAVVLTASAVIAIAIAINRCIETPMRRWIRSGLRTAKWKYQW